MSKSEQILWILWLLACTSSAVFFGYGGCAHAQDLKSQIVTNVKCPQTALCVKNENGIWIPMWYAQDLLKVRAQFETVRKDLAAANEEITHLRVAIAEHSLAGLALEKTATYEKTRAEIFEKRSEKAENKSSRRLKWLAGSSVVSAVVIAILSAAVATQ